MSYEYRSFRKAKFQYALCEKLRCAHAYLAARMPLVRIAAWRAMYRVAQSRRLFLAEAVNDPHGGAVISLAGATVRFCIDRAEIGVFVVHFDQANRPALFEFHVQAAARHPSTRPAPMTVRIEAALAFKVISGVTRSD